MYARRYDILIVISNEENHAGIINVNRLLKAVTNYANIFLKEIARPF